MILLHIIINSISAVSAYAVFVYFLVTKYYQASIWAFATGLIASIRLQIHWLRYKNTLAEYYTARYLWSLAWIGFSMFALGVSGFIYNLIIFCVLDIPIFPVKHNTIISVIFSLLTLITGILLFWDARKYAHYIQIDRTKLEEDTTSQEEPTTSQDAAIVIDD